MEVYPTLAYEVDSDVLKTGYMQDGHRSVSTTIMSEPVSNTKVSSSGSDPMNTEPVY